MSASIQHLKKAVVQKDYNKRLSPKHTSAYLEVLEGKSGTLELKYSDANSQGFNV